MTNSTYLFLFILLAGRFARARSKLDVYMDVNSGSIDPEEVPSSG